MIAIIHNVSFILFLKFLSGSRFLQSLFSNTSFHIMGAAAGLCSSSSNRQSERPKVTTTPSGTVDHSTPHNRVYSYSNTTVIHQNVDQQRPSITPTGTANTITNKNRSMEFTNTFIDITKIIYLRIRE